LPSAGILLTEGREFLLSLDKRECQAAPACRSSFEWHSKPLVNPQLLRDRCDLRWITRAFNPRVADTVTVMAGDEMHMQVKNRLSRCLTVGHDQVETIRLEYGHDPARNRMRCRHERRHQRLLRRPPVGYVHARHDQDVARIDRSDGHDRERRCVAVHHRGWQATGNDPAKHARRIHNALHATAGAGVADVLPLVSVDRRVR